MLSLAARGLRARGHVASVGEAACQVCTANEGLEITCAMRSFGQFDLQFDMPHILRSSATKAFGLSGKAKMESDL